MPAHKRHEFGAEENELAAFARALGHPARIAILKELASRKSCVCGEIVEVLPLAQSTVSQHLKELLAAGLIQGTIEGPRSCYCLNPDTFKRFEQHFATFFSQTNPANNCC
jgi:ArsR family transcriptional regulator, arsenate/arsenite/antimonite-responsive transcriptional repressor